MDTASLARSGGAADAIRAARLIAILRRVEPCARLISLVDQLVDDGIRIVEITFDRADAPADLPPIRAHLESTESRYAADRYALDVSFEVEEAAPAVDEPR